MNADYVDLKALSGMRGYQKLQALWAHEYGLIMQALQRAAARNQESAWRYQAGQLKGAELMTGMLERAVLQMEKEGEGESPATQTVEELMKEIKGNGNHP